MPPISSPDSFHRKTILSKEVVNIHRRCTIIVLLHQFCLLHLLVENPAIYIILALLAKEGCSTGTDKCVYFPVSPTMSNYDMIRVHRCVRYDDNRDS